MRKRIKYKILYLLSQTPARDLLEKYRHMGLKKSDIFLISYQNSGSSWLRNLLYESITGKESWKKDSKKEFAFIGNHNQLKSLVDERRFIKSHSPYRKEYKGKKIIYIVRDPRDVFISKYEKRKKNLEKKESKNKAIKNFIKGKIMSEGSWDKHVGSWINAKKQNKVNLCLVKYKDLKQNPKRELKKILNFLNLIRNEEQIKKAIENNTIQKTKNKKNVRKGIVGDWKKELTNKQAKKIENNFGRIMNKLNYLK